MQQEYTIEWMERKTTSTGKNKIDATIKSISGVTHENVTIWEGFPNFDTLMPGSHVTGEYYEKQNGQYLNKTLSAPRVTGPRASGPSGIKAAQERKAVAIHEAQENKNGAIKESAAQRDAVLITTTFFADLVNEPEDVRDSLIKEKIEGYRDYFLQLGEKAPF